MNKFVNKIKSIFNGTRKGIIFILLIIFLVFFSTRIVFASSSLGNIFGGKIIYTKAPDIQELEDFGYTCDVPGTSISIMPIGSPPGTPTDYLIPYGIVSKTGTTPRSGQLIIGLYTGQTTIVCVQTSGETEDTETVSLNTIFLFGTSK